MNPSDIFPEDGRLLVDVDTTSSTNDLVRTWGRRGGADGATVFADQQTTGRGRSGRRWHSPPRLNIYLSRLVRAGLPLLRLAPLLGAVATCEAVAQHLGSARVAIKWPNDILANDRKLAGILTELETGPDAFAVVGIGVNVNMQAEDFPADLRTPATSLCIERGEPVERALLRESLLEQLGTWRTMLDHDPDRLIAAYTARCATLGTRVRVTPPGHQPFTGRAVRLGPDGALWVERNGAEQVRIEAGDVDACS